MRRQRNQAAASKSAHKIKHLAIRAKRRTMCMCMFTFSLKHGFMACRRWNDAGSDHPVEEVLHPILGCPALLLVQDRYQPRKPLDLSPMLEARHPKPIPTRRYELRARSLRERAEVPVVHLDLGPERVGEPLELDVAPGARAAAARGVLTDGPREAPARGDARVRGVDDEVDGGVDVVVVGEPVVGVGEARG